jgi:hypothetical protein
MTAVTGFAPLSGTVSLSRQDKRGFSSGESFPVALASPRNNEQVEFPHPPFCQGDQKKK